MPGDPLREPAQAEKETPRKEGHKWDYLGEATRCGKKHFQVNEGPATSAPVLEKAKKEWRPLHVGTEKNLGGADDY